MYSDLVPIDTLDSEAESLKALHWGISNYKIRNIALTGPYGAGKSSIIKSYLKQHPNCKAIKEVVLRFAALVVVLFGVGYIIRYITSKFTIKEITVGDISAQGEEISNESVLNRNIDEMLYFFERTKYDVVFIEDLDRFNSTSIFIKLREINTILNQYDVIKKRGKITFVYAVRDDLFQDETERTKFFDFLIPVIPVINSTNSGEMMPRCSQRGC